MPLSENRVVESPPSEPAKLFSLLEWKDKMGKKPKDEKKDENVDAMDEKNLIVKLLQLTAYEGVSESKLRKVVKYAMEVMSENK